MYRDYDSERRRYGRAPITEIPGPGARRTGDPFLELQRLRQEAAQAAEWREAAEHWHAIAKQQQAALKEQEKQMQAVRRQLAAAQRESETSPPTPSAPAAHAADNEEWREKYLRLYADYENAKKRLAQRLTLATEQKQAELLRDMLPLADNLERALTHAQAAEDVAGLALIHKAFLEVLAKYGVAKIVAEKRPFDPELHEAVGTIPHPDAAPGEVIAVIEAGYTYQGKLLRPARVMVAA